MEWHNMHYVNSCTMWGDPQSIFGTLQLVLNWRISKGPKQCYRKIVHKTIKIHAKKSFLAKYAWASLFKKFKTHLFICCFVILCSHVFPPLWVCVLCVCMRDRAEKIFIYWLLYLLCNHVGMCNRTYAWNLFSPLSLITYEQTLEHLAPIPMLM